MYYGLINVTRRQLKLFRTIIIIASAQQGRVPQASQGVSAVPFAHQPYISTAIDAITDQRYKE